MKFSLHKTSGSLYFFLDEKESVDPLLRREVGHTLLSLERPPMSFPIVFLLETPILLLLLPQIVLVFLLGRAQAFPDGAARDSQQKELTSSTHAGNTSRPSSVCTGEWCRQWGVIRIDSCCLGGTHGFSYN